MRAFNEAWERGYDPHEWVSAGGWTRTGRTEGPAPHCVVRARPSAPQDSPRFKAHCHKHGAYHASPRAAAVSDGDFPDTGSWTSCLSGPPCPAPLRPALLCPALTSAAWDAVKRDFEHVQGSGYPDWAPRFHADDSDLPPLSAGDT